MIHHLHRATWQLIFWSLLAAALGLTTVRLALHGVGHFRQELTAYVSDMLGAPVKIGHLATKMRGFTPELLLDNIVVSSVAQRASAVRLKQIRIKLDLLALLANREVLPATSIILVGTKLTVQRNPDGSFSVKGLKASDQQPLWLLQGSHYEMLQSEIVFQDLKHGGKPWQAAAIDLAISNSGDQHRLNAIIKLPFQANGELRLAAAIAGDFFSSARLNGQIFITSQDLQPAAMLADYFPLAARLNHRSVAGKLWASIKDSRLLDLQGEIKLTATAKNSLPFLQTRFHWYRHNPADERWRLDVPWLQITGPSLAGVANSFSLAGDFSRRRWAWSIANLDLQASSAIGQWLLPEDYAKLLVQYRPVGSVSHCTGFADQDLGLYALNSQFQDLSIAPVADWPGFSHLSGKINGSSRRGTLVLASANAALDYPGLFRQALPLKQLQASVAWQQDDQQWQLSSPALKLSVSGIASESRLRLAVPKNSAPPFLDWQAILTGDDISQIKNYLPAKIIKKADLDWLDAAFVKGRITEGRMLYYGPLGPLSAAVFQALLDVDGVELSYDPEWPNLTGLAGRVSFLQNKMICEASQGHSQNLDIVKATVVHPGIGVSKQLQINGQVLGGLPGALEFLRQTPLREDLGGLLAAIQAQGQTQVSLDLDLALSDQGRTRLDGKAQLNQARLKVKAIDLWLEQIKGELKFNETGVYSDTITATAFDHPAAFSVSHDQQQTRIAGHGQADIYGLKEHFAMPFWEIAQGALDYQLQLDLPRDDSPPVLNLQSTLKGVALDLPKPLAKQPEQSKPLAVSFTLVNEPLLPITIDYDQQFKAAIKLDTRSQALHSGSLLLGEGAVGQVSEDGLGLEINQPRLDLAELSGFSAATRHAGGAPAINKLIVRSRDALWNNQPLGFFNLTLNHEGNYWLGAIDSKLAQGKVQIPADLNPAGNINFNLQQLDLSALPTPAGNGRSEPRSFAASSPLSPQQLPLFIITSQKTLWRGVDLGQLNLRTERRDYGLAVNQASLTGPEQSLVFSGSWKHLGAITATTVNGTLAAAKAGQLLNRLNISHDFKETSGKADFALSWPAPPYDFQARQLSGTLTTTLNNGRILSIEPGFGRVLGLVAMAQWSKRVQLDFRDIFAEGLSFNRIHGDFYIEKGIAHTDNLLIDAVPAKISIVGDADLGRKTLDNIVRVIPKSAEALPIAGTIVDNVVSLASRTLTGDSGEGFFLASQYQIKGPWQDMRITPLHENEGLLQKTWDAIAAFPWSSPSAPQTSEQ